MRILNSLLTVILISCFLYAGCERADKSTDAEQTTTERVVEEAQEMVEDPVEKTEEIHSWQEQKQAEDAPPKIAAELWDLIQTENYRVSWKMWPGKEALYKGTHPHGSYLTTYLNDIALKSLEGEGTELDPGSIIVKENYTPEKTLAAITVMYKLAGYDPGNNNWFWAKYSPDGKPMSAETDGESTMLVGKVPGCIDCHTSNKANDYIMTSPINTE